MILVVGPGRCGSSAVARVLHERMGVSMGKVFPVGDEYNPEGYYEDSEFKFHNQAFLDGRMRFPEFWERIGHLIRQRREPWGLKDPRLCYLLPFYLSLIPDAKIIRCRRPLADIQASMKRCYGWEGEEAVRRERALDLVNHPMLEIEMSEPRTDEWIEEKLCPVLKS